MPSGRAHAWVRSSAAASAIESYRHRNVGTAHRARVVCRAGTRSGSETVSLGRLVPSSSRTWVVTAMACPTSLRPVRALGLDPNGSTMAEFHHHDPCHRDPEADQREPGDLATG